MQYDITGLPPHPVVVTTDTQQLGTITKLLIILYNEINDVTGLKI